MNRRIIEITGAIALTLASTGAAWACSTMDKPHARASLILAADSGHAIVDVKAGDLTIATPVIKATPPNAPVSGGYMNIGNSGMAGDRLVAGSADFAAKVEIHEMAMDGDVMKMRPVEGGLEIPAGGSVELKPGGYHVMFIGLKEQMKPGEKRKAKLVFEKAGEVEIEFDVMEIKPGGQM